MTREEAKERISAIIDDFNKFYRITELPMDKNDVYLFDVIFGIHYTFSTALAFAVSTFSNWGFGKLILFRQKSRNVAGEIFKIYLISVIGLLMNIAIMFVAIEKIGISDMISKIIATGIVFVWNFLIRKFWIYKV